MMPGPTDPARESNRPFSVAQLARHWGVSESMIRKLIAEGKLPAFKIGNLFRVSADEVRRYEAGGSSNEAWSLRSDMDFGRD